MMSQTPLKFTSFANILPETEPYTHGHTGSHLISEANKGLAQLTLEWETAWEY